jgi:hypothetical protein
MRRAIVTTVIGLALGAALVLPAAAQEVLPFPPKPSGSIAGRTMQESVYSPLPPVSHLPKDAPNILIVLIDDVGPAQTDAYGGEIHTPTLSRIAKEGISYNRFHTAGATARTTTAAPSIPKASRSPMPGRASSLCSTPRTTATQELRRSAVFPPTATASTT